MAEQTLQVLHEIESLKEMGSIEAGKNEVHIYYGKSMKNIIERIREEKVSGTAPVKFIIYYVENAAEKTEEINCLTQELNANSNYIQLKKATNECIVLYVEMMKDILMNFDTLFCAVTSFLRYVFKRVFLQSEDNEEMLVVMITAEDDLDVYLDSKEPVMQSNPTNLESCSLVLNLEVKNEVFATTEKFENSISEFASKLIKKTNGRQLFPQKDIHVVIQPGESDDIDPTEPDVKSYPTYVKSGDNPLELNVKVKNKTVDTAARVKKSIGANEKQVNRILSELEKIHSSKDKDRDVLVVKNIPKNVTDETLENYLEVICQVEVDHLYFHGLPKCKQVSEVAIVLLKEKLIDLKKIEEKSKRKKIEGQVIQLCRLESPEGVVVFGLPKETTEDELTLYFERKKIAGIDAVVTQCIIHKRIDVGVVQYTDNDTALQNITKVNHRIRDKDLICEPYYSNFHNTVIESLMEFSSDNLSPCDYEYKSGTKHLPTQDEDITYSLGGKLEIVSKTPDEDDPGYARADINRNSKSGSRKSIISQHIAGCKETDDEGYEIAGTVCGINEHEDAFKDIESIQSVHKYYEIPPEVPITPRPSEERREGPCNLEDGYNDEVSIEKGKIILLRMMGFTKMCKECKIDLNTATDVVSFNGSKDAVMEAKLKMFQELEGVTEVTKVVSKGHAAVLKAGSSWIKNTLKQENICAFGSVKGDNLLCIQAFSKREALKGLKNILSCLDVVEISYTELAFDYLNSAEWKEFLKKNTKGSTEIDRQKNVIIIEGTKEECQLEKDIIEWELRKIEAHKLDKIELKESKSLDFPYGQHKQMDRVENELRDTSSDIHAHRRHTVADFRFDARPNYVPYEHRWNTWKWSTHFGSVEVILKQGVISNEKADVLVNVVAVKDNCKFTASRVAKSFVNRSPEFEKRYMLAIQQWDGKGYVLMTENSGIPHCKAICHLHLPTWTGDKSVLTTAISNCFKMCSKMNAQCVAFPPVGFGQLLQYPLDEVISCMIAESKVAAQKSQSIQKIKFIIFDDDTVDKFKERIKGSSASGGHGNRSHDKDHDHKEKSTHTGNHRESVAAVTIELFAVSKQDGEKLRTKLSEDIKETFLYENKIKNPKLKSVSRETKSKMYAAANQNHVWIDHNDESLTFKGEKDNVTKTKEKIYEILLKDESRGRGNYHKKYSSEYWIEESQKSTETPDYWKHKGIFGTLKDKGKELFFGIDGNLVDVDDKTKNKVTSLVGKTWISSLVGQGKDARGLSHSKIVVTRVQRIENSTLYEKYFAKKKEFYRKLAHGKQCPAIENVSSKGKKVSKGPILTAKCSKALMTDMDLASHANEFYFFHGTPDEYVKNIVNKGIDEKLGGDNSMFGPGIYGAESSTKADQYADDQNKRQNKDRKMLLIRLLLGNMYVTDKAHKYKIPPCSRCLTPECRKHDHEPFDSVVADGSWLFREFIVYRNEQCYPEYLITYDRV